MNPKLLDTWSGETEINPTQIISVSVKLLYNQFNYLGGTQPDEFNVF